MRPWTAIAAPRAADRAAGFNGATALRPWTVDEYVERHERSPELQWGHGLAAVDGRVDRGL